MTAHEKKPANCPNCGTPVSGNYCTQCGQEAHLHEETFWHMILHFVGHYFHFDSKFWVSVKTLIFKPGKLTLAWHNKQRMRYVAPVNFYIFTSVAFFILFSFTVKFEQITETEVRQDGHAYYDIEYHYSFGRYNFKEIRKAHHEEGWVVEGNCDSLRKVAKDLKELDERNTISAMLKEPFSFSFDYAYLNFYNYFVFPYAYRHKMLDLDGPVSEIVEKYLHLIPKVLFILMPLLALLLNGTFFNRKDYFFVDHGILSLHTHIFLFFSISLQLILGSFMNLSGSGWVFLFFVAIPYLHFLLACHNFYKRKWWYTLLMGTLTWTIYLFLVIIVSLTVLLLMIHFS